MSKTSATTTPLNSPSNSNVSVDDLADQVKGLKADIAELTKSLSDYGTSKTSEAAHAARAKAEEYGRAGRDKALEAQMHAEDFIHKQPATALGIAAGVGFLVGMIMTSRR